MVERLIEATMQVCAEKKHLPIVIDDVIRAADVSRGTFYKYFESLDDLIALAGTRLADEITREGAAMVANVERPIYRTAVGLRLTLGRALIDPNWGAFVSRMVYTGNDSFIETHASREYLEGRAAGEYSFERLETVIDVTLGAISAAIRRLISGDAGPDYIDEVSVHILLALGARSKDAAEATKASIGFLERNAADRPAWWRGLNGAMDASQKT